MSAPTSAQKQGGYVTSGHPVKAGAGYDCGCGECLAVRAAPRPAPDVDGLRDTDTWDGYYLRDEYGHVLTTCSETGRERDYIVCGHPVPGGVYCGHEGRREECPDHAR